MNIIPAIQSQGDPPERHARRVVAAMLQWLVPKHDEMIRLAAMSFNRPNGNPKAQARSTARLEKNEAVLATRLQPGKRGNFAVTMYDWGVWDLVRDDEATIFHQNSDRLWLVCWRNEYVFERGKLANDFSLARLFITYHALHRLAERCGARTWQDLVAALREIWMAYYTHMGPECDARLAPPLRRIALSGGGVAVLEPYEPLTEGGKQRPAALIVATILKV